MLVAGVDVSGRTTGVTAIAWLDGARRVVAGVAAIETWPMGVYRMLARAAGETAPDTGPDWRRRLLATRVDGLDGMDGVDRLDAVAAAYTAWCRRSGQAVAVTGDPGEGAIWIPAATPPPPPCGPPASTAAR